jgi:pimeloyl-ACP methyl ester carboxylesterase
MGYLPEFIPGECVVEFPEKYMVECGVLVVPEDHDNPDDGDIQLNVAVFRSQNENKSPDPVFHLIGGPGGSLLDSATFYLRVGGDAILEKRDYVFFNQRGTRYNTPYLSCDGYADLQWGLNLESLPPETRMERENEFLLDCMNSHEDAGVDLNQYNNIENANDVNDLRIALGYEKINLYGISYGGRLALSVMREHPEIVRSAIIDSSYAPNASLWTEIPHNAKRVFDLIIDTCAEDTVCNLKYPNLGETFYQLVEDLIANPVEVTLANGKKMLLSGYDLMSFSYNSLYSFYEEGINYVPLVIDQTNKGNHSIVAEAIAENAWDDIFAWGMHYAITCQVDIKFEPISEARARMADLPVYIQEYYLPLDFLICEAWHGGEVDPVENLPVVSDIPTLVLTGRFDPITPPYLNVQVAETLSNSFYYEFPDIGHGVMRGHDCALEIGLQFLDDPTAEPDASCMEELGTPVFR